MILLLKAQQLRRPVNNIFYNVLFLSTRMHISVNLVFINLNIGHLFLTRTKTLHIGQIVISLRELLRHLLNSLVSLFQLSLKGLDLVLELVVFGLEFRHFGLSAVLRVFGHLGEVRSGCNLVSLLHGTM